MLRRWLIWLHLPPSSSQISLTPGGSSAAFIVTSVVCFVPVRGGVRDPVAIGSKMKVKTEITTARANWLPRAMRAKVDGRINNHFGAVPNPVPMRS